MTVTVVPVVDTSHLDGLSTSEQVINKSKFIGNTIVAGGPTLCNYARGLTDNTADYFDALNREHVCGINKKVKGKQALKTGLIAEMIDTTRLAIESGLKALATSSFGTWLACQVRWVVKRLKELKRFIQKVKDMIEVVQYYVVFAAEMVKWISSLPAQIIGFMSQCLKDFAKGVGSLLLDTITGSDDASKTFDSISTDAKSLGNSLNDLQSTLTDVVTTTTNTLTAAISVPADMPSLKSLTKYNPAV